MPNAPNTSADRAKQFIPFAALRGFYELVADVTRHREPKRDLLPDHEDELDAALQEIEPGDILKVVHYHDGCYITTIGMLVELQKEEGVLVIDGTPFDAKCIIDIELLSASQM